MRKNNIGYANIMLEFMRIEHGYTSVTEKYIQISSLLVGLIHTFDYALFVYDDKKHIMQPVCSSRITKEYLIDLTNELNTISLGLTRRPIHKKSGTGKKESEQVYIPLFVENTLQGVLVASNVTKVLFKELKSKEIFNCIETLGYVIKGIKYSSLIEKITYSDSLTKLADERLLRNDLTKTFEDGRYVNYTFVQIKINGLKDYNAACGYSQGNKVLKEMSGLLRSIIANQETVYHLYGSQFVMLLKCNHREAYNRMKQVVERVSTRIYVDITPSGPLQHKLSISVGMVNLSTLQEKECLVDTVYQYANLALKQGADKTIFIYGQNLFFEDEQALNEATNNDKQDETVGINLDSSFQSSNETEEIEENTTFDIYSLIDYS